MNARFFLIPALAALLASPVAAQLGLPRIQGPQVRVPQVGGVLDPVTRTVDRTLEETLRATDRLARELAEDRLERIKALVRRHGDLIALDREGAPARRGELLVMGADRSALTLAADAGFAVLGEEEVEGLGFSVTRLGLPAGLDLAEAEPVLASLLPDATIAPDHLHFQSGATAPAPLAFAWGAASGPSAPVGMIDGAAGSAIPVADTRGFAKGAPAPSNHGSAIASLLRHAGIRTIRVADVYGTDPAGGSALAIARGLGWLVGEGSKVVTISLVGPKNPVLARAISAARDRGVVVLAAVGNDGPAAPPAYPASYEGVVAVTAVDGRERALIEAGRALDLDYAAPGADIRGLNAKGRPVNLRGTSFATPLAAARIAHAMGRGASWRSALDAEAEDLGEDGADPVYGRGLVCGECEGVD